MASILLTGAGGFIGARIWAHLSARHRVLTFPRGMLAGAEQQQVRSFALQARPDAIIHTAAIADMGVCEQHPNESYRANVLLTQWLCEAAQEMRIKAVCYSSDQVYNGCDPSLGPYTESMSLSPVNVYARHKLEAEQHGLDACPGAVMLRATWMYDLTGSAVETRGGFLPGLVRQAAENRAERFSTSDFRGVTYAMQAARLTEQALALPGGAYNFGSPNNLHMADTARAALEALGLGERADELIEQDPVRQPRCLTMDPAKLNAAGICFDSTVNGFARCVQEARAQGWTL